MHLASRLYEAVVRSSEDTLKEGFKYTDAGLARDWQIVRLAALLHDIGHPPFSHAAEMLLPMKESKGSSLVTGSGSKPSVEQYAHEDYSVEIIEKKLKDLIEQHPCNRRNYRITMDEITSLISKRTTAGSTTLFWKDIISGQLDADRMDYLLRDSLHAGVSYGRYDHDRIVSSICAVRRRKKKYSEPKIAIMKGGMYAAEALIVARYWITKQVYFHKTRLACDYHLGQALGEILAFEAGSSTEIVHFPRPDSGEELEKYLKWDDYRVMELLLGGKGGEHGNRLVNRNHYRLVCELEVSNASVDELTASKKRNDAVVAELGAMVKYDFSPKASWYKTNPILELLVVDNDGKTEIGLLSEHSAFMKSINIGSLRFVYVDKDDAEKARSVYKKFLESESVAKAASENAVEAKPESGSSNSTAEAPVKDLQLKLEPPLNNGKPARSETTPQKGGNSNAI